MTIDKMVDVSQDIKCWVKWYRHVMNGSSTCPISAIYCLVPATSRRPVFASAISSHPASIWSCDKTKFLSRSLIPQSSVHCPNSIQLKFNYQTDDGWAACCPLPGCCSLEMTEMDKKAPALSWDGSRLTQINVKTWRWNSLLLITKVISIKDPCPTGWLWLE